MAAPARGLAIVLTSAMVAALFAPVHTGSPGSGWWGTQEARKLSQAAHALSEKGDFNGARRIYRQGAQIAARRHDLAGEAWFAGGIGDVLFASYDYSGALDQYLHARILAERARDPLVLGAIELNLASLYQQMWDSSAALDSLEHGWAVIQHFPPVFYRPQMLQLLGRLRANQTSIGLYRRSIALAVASGSKRGIEAGGFRLLGSALLDRGDLGGAATALEKALASARSPQEIAATQFVLGKLRLTQAGKASGERRAALLQQAGELTDKAIAAHATASYLLQFQRAQVLLAQGQVEPSLEAMQEAIRLAQIWRVGIVPAQTSVDSVTTALQQNLFDGFVTTAVDYGIRTRDSLWIERAFEATELNRSINLRESAEAGSSERLPAAYWKVLGELKRREESPANSRNRAAMANLTLRLSELESRAGLGYLPNIAENFPSHASLILFQNKLKDSELFLSFGLEKRESFLWAVTRTNLQVYRLPPAGEIVSRVRSFREAVEDRSAVGTAGKRLEDEGKQLYRLLFGQLNAAEAARPEWLLSVGDALLELPFGALVTGSAGTSAGGRRPFFLVERHSLEVRPGAMLAGPPPPRPPGGFLAVGDPIYNAADPRRARQPQIWSIFAGESGSAGPAGQLNRLPGTRREVDAAAAAWASGSAAGSQPTVLTGVMATRQRFLDSLRPVPKVIHIATHALAGGGLEEPSDGHASLAFGLEENGSPGLLTSPEIRSLRVPGSTVVMTGCQTAPRGTPSGLGLAGLVRAWTVAGAAAVVATEWPVEDSSGTPLLASFYRHLRARPGTPAAQALQLAQIDMIHSGTAQSAPAVWAAYQSFGGEPAFGGQPELARSKAP